MTIRKYRRKPEPRDDSLLTAALYEPGGFLDDLRKVAAEARHGEIAECALPSGPVLLAAWDETSEYGSHKRYEAVPAGHWLCWSPRYEELTTSSGGDLTQWYEPAAV